MLKLTAKSRRSCARAGGAVAAAQAALGPGRGRVPPRRDRPGRARQCQRLQERAAAISAVNVYGGNPADFLAKGQMSARSTCR